jgi:ABC-type sugar transport system permease subunit
MRLKLRTRKALYGYLFILPWIVGFVGFLLGPLIKSIILSFSTVEGLLNLRLVPVGFENYRRAFLEDGRFVTLLTSTMKNNLIDIPMILIFSLILALLLNKKMFGQPVFKSIFFLPVVVASGVVVKNLFEQDVGGMVISADMNIPGLIANYLGDSAGKFVAAFVNRTVLVLWHSGVQTLLFLAGLQGISPSLYEAGRVDGGSEWELFWKVTLPMLSPIILINIIYTMVDFFTDWTNGVMHYISFKAFKGGFELGYASAMGWLYFMFIFILIVIVMILSRNRIYYAGEK